MTISVFLLAACGSSEDMTEYVEVSFSGMDTQGTASYDVDVTGLIGEIFDLEEADDNPDKKTAKEIESVLSAYDVKVKPESDLANGDEVTVVVSVDEEKTDKITGGEKKFTVKDLEEPKKVTTKDVEEKLVVNFNGVSGRGVAQIDNIFDESPMSDITFEIENDGELKNEDQATVIVGSDFEDVLQSNGYILEEDFNPTFEVTGLDVVAEKAEDIKNLEDIERFLDEELNDDYENTDYEYGMNYRYEIEQESLMYRQFEKTSDQDASISNMENNNGNLVGLFSIKHYSISNDEETLQDEFKLIYGFAGIILDEDNKANLAELINISERKEDSYSIDSIIQLYEGEGYEKVKE